MARAAPCPPRVEQHQIDGDLLACCRAPLWHRLPLLNRADDALIEILLWVAQQPDCDQATG